MRSRCCYAEQSNKTILFPHLTNDILVLLSFLELPNKLLVRRQCRLVFSSLQSRRFLAGGRLFKVLKFVMGRHFESTQPVECNFSDWLEASVSLAIQDVGQ